MVATPELDRLHRAVAELNSALGAVPARYGDIPAVKRLRGDVERIALDATELDDITPLPAAEEGGPIQVIEDKPDDPAMWADADDEGLGGYGGRR